jgi:hypothetical protein
MTREQILAGKDSVGHQRKLRILWSGRELSSDHLKWTKTKLEVML